MEFLLGSISSLLAVAAAIFIKNRIPKTMPLKIIYRQSTIFETLKPALPVLQYFRDQPETQATKYFDSKRLKIVVVDDKAYWIQDNAVFQSEYLNGVLDQENRKVVDTMGMDKVELDKLSYIVDKLTKGGNNDSGYPRH